MAERRMFAKTIIDSDAFLDMPLSTQALYFHLSMRADDDGFINNPKKIQRMVGASDDDGKLLTAKNFIIPFETGVVVIKHWKIHNYIQKDRYKETVYKEEKRLLEVKENNSYTLASNVGNPKNERMDTPCIQNGYQTDTQYRIGKDSLGEERDSTNNNVSETETIYSDVISYLNLKTDKNFKATTAITKRLIKARVKEGFTLEDFKLVIDKKCLEWLGTEWAKYLKPDTLFGNKFEGYLNANTVVKKADKNDYNDFMAQLAAIREN